MQRILVGRPGQSGTGAIPKDAIVDLVSARGTPDLLDLIKERISAFLSSDDFEVSGKLVKLVVG